MGEIDDRPESELSMAQRVELLIKWAGGPVKTSERIGVSRGTLLRWVKGENPNLLELYPLCLAFGRTLEWVISGELFPSALLPAGERPSELAMSKVGDPPRGYARLLPLKWHSGGRHGVIEEDMPSDFSITHAWLYMRGLSAENVRYAVAGDRGMEPAVPAGATVLVDIRPVKLRTGVYVVQVGDEFLVRRMQMLPGEHAELVADANPSWRFSVLGPDVEKLSLHRVIWFAADL